MPDCSNGSTTTTTSPGFTSETSTTCRYDKVNNKSTCINKYKDSFKTETTTVSVTTYAKLEDAIDETRVNPPRRRSLRTDTTVEGSRGKSTTSLVNTYDGQNRLVREVGTSTPGTTATTTYSEWDAAGRPTAGRSVVEERFRVQRSTFSVHFSIQHSAFRIAFSASESSARAAS